MANIVPRSLLGSLDTPSLLPRLWDDNWFTQASGVNITEDENNVFVEAAVPGINTEDLEVTYQRGMLLIRSKSEDNAKEGNARAYRTLSYSVAVPGDIAEDTTPEARCENGMLRVSFQKSPAAQPMKIQVKKG